MKLDTIKNHFKDYSISKKRKTTINHAFASALAPHDDYNRDIEKLKHGIRLLGQSPDEELICIYCDKPAQTWDHIEAVVSKTVYSGFGHQVGNLVPCCKDCNSSRGNMDWKVYLAKTVKESNKLEIKISQIEKYVKLLPKAISYDYMRESCPVETQKYDEIKNKIILLMSEADRIAYEIRLKLQNVSK
ncbi:hypothetical protein [Anaerospora hongkongensis]|uniref:hypothetical protein n=1 Tax=Anaerospora hongkongensis TaxID=244830 RepID=UPI0028963466|nr:hypothetical protein [Anaerospora hongkongensis]